MTGFTNAQGQYDYRVGDTVTFDIGGRPIGNPVAGAPEITPLSLFGINDITDQRVVNLSRLLLTLGGGAPNGNNVIVINSGAIPPLPVTLNFNVPTTTFAANMAASGGGTGPTLVPETTATTHLQQNFATITVTLAGSGTGTVTSLPGRINCPTTCSFAFNKVNPVTLQAIGTGFAGWSNGTGSAAGCTGTGNCSFTPGSDSNITATFNVPPPATLTTPIVGDGSVSCRVSGGAFEACAGPYASGTALVIQATANSGSTFTGWSAGSGNATICNNTTSNCAFTITANSSITANFAVNVTMFSVTAAAATGNGGGGTVQCSVSGGAAGACGSYPVGTAVSVIATPDGVSLFSGWSGASGSGLTPNCNSATGPCNFTLTGNTSITGNFNRPVLTVNVAGTGTVNSNPTGINNCTALNCQAPFDKGAVITLTASGAGFAGWSLGSCPGTGTCPVTLNASTAVTATFGSASSSTIFKFIGAPGRELLAVNPASPTTPTPVKVNNQDVILGDAAVKLGSTLDRSSNGMLILSATFSGNSTATNFRQETIVFTSGGKVYKASTLVSSGVPGSTVANEPQQVSSLTGVVSCGMKQSYDAVNPNPGFGVVTPGADNLCNTPDDQVIVMHLNDSTGTAPVLLSPGTVPIAPGIFDPSTGRLLQVLLKEALTGNLSAMDPTTAVITPIVNGTGIGGVEVLAIQPDKVFLGTSRKLYIYTPSTHTLNATPVVTADPNTEFVEDKGPSVDLNNIFLVQKSDGAVYKVPLTTPPGTQITAKHFTAAGATGAFLMGLTTNKVIIVTGSDPSGGCVTGNTITCNNGLLAVDKVTANQSTVLEAAVSQKSIYIKEPFGNHVLYEIWEPSPSTFKGAARIVEDASSPRELMGPNGSWIGDTWTGPLSLIELRTSMASALFFHFTGPVSPATGGCTTFNGVFYCPETGTVNVISTPAGPATVLGTVTASMNIAWTDFDEEPPQSTVIGIGTLNEPPPANHLPFFVDITKANSLVPITTPGLPAPWKVITD